MQAAIKERIYYNKNGILVRDATICDAIIIGHQLRESDAREVWSSHHHTPHEALRLSYEISEMCFTVEIKGVPAIMFGAAPPILLSDRATIWLLATDGILSVRKSLVKECRRFIDMMLQIYPFLENYVDARNTLSMKWLTWCGAVMEDPQPYGIEKLPFRHFYFRRNDHV
ncbi:MAG: hypothetical protein JXB40_05780 [Candidatus Omnitrophica bacterium]|nr:hypothetical protein [Candidatus Omnitrophota bacterium]